MPWIDDAERAGGEDSSIAWLPLEDVQRDRESLIALAREHQFSGEDGECSACGMPAEARDRCPDRPCRPETLRWWVDRQLAFGDRIIFEFDPEVSVREQPRRLIQGLWFADLDAAAAFDLDRLQPVPVRDSWTQFESWEDAALWVREKRGI